MDLHGAIDLAATSAIPGSAPGWGDQRALFPVAFPSRRYQMLYVDPPWAYYGSTDKYAAAGKHYPLMPLADIQALPMRDIMERKSALFLWATAPLLHHAIETIAAWGLHFRGVAYVWVKTTKDGRPLGGQGVPPTFTKPTCEFVLAATPHRRGRPFTLGTYSQHQVVLAPRGEHSAKPAEVRERLEVLCPNTSRIELFARGAVPGWDTWGQEALPEEPPAEPPAEDDVPPAAPQSAPGADGLDR